MALSLDRNEIQKILPHREPFLFVDRVREIEEGARIVGELEADHGLRFLARHTGSPYLPPVILAEAMAQVGAILVLFPEENRGRTIYFRAIDTCAFERPVPAGATVRIEARVRKLRSRYGSLGVEAEVDGSRVANAVMSFALG